MAGESSNLGASASPSASTKMAKQQQEKRKQRATRAEKAKKPRPFQIINFTAHPRPRGSGTAAPSVVPPLHRGASNNMATPAFPFPMPGVNGAAPLWSTAAALGAALASSSLPATVRANGPAAAPVVIAPTPGLQPPPAGAAASNAAAAAAALALPAASSGAIDVRPPLVFAQAGTGGQLVPLPLQFVGYHATCHSSAVGLPAPAVGIPLAAALDKIENGALGRMLSALMPVCNPPLRQHHSKSGPPPPWWPTGWEDWWATELLPHVDTVAVPVPFAPSYSLKKAQKVAVLVAMVKHLAPDFARIATAVRLSGKLSVSETDLWHSALNNERAKYTRPVFILLPQQQGGVGSGSGSSSTDPSAAGSVVVHSGNNAASNGCELQVQVANLPAGASSASAAPADGSRGEVIAAAEVVAENEQRGDSDSVGVGVGVGVVLSATDAPAGDGRDQPVNFPAAAGVDGGSTDKQGAAVAAAPTGGHVRQVAGEPEEMTMQPEQDGGEVIAAAELMVEKEQRSHSGGAGVVSATDDAPAGDGRDQPVNNFPAGGDDSTHEQGAAVAAAPTTGHVREVAAEPEMVQQQQPEQDGGVPGNDMAAAAEDDQVQVQPVIDVEVEGDNWWHNNDELINRMFAEFESFGDDVWY